MVADVVVNPGIGLRSGVAPSTVKVTPAFTSPLLETCAIFWAEADVDRLRSGVPLSSKPNTVSEMTGSVPPGTVKVTL